MALRAGSRYPAHPGTGSRRTKSRTDDASNSDFPQVRPFGVEKLIAGELLVLAFVATYRYIDLARGCCFLTLVGWLFGPSRTRNITYLTSHAELLHNPRFLDIPEISWSIS